MVIPVLVAEIDPTQYQYSSWVTPWAYGTPVWQGVYVFSVTLSDGPVLRDNVAHMEESQVCNSGLDEGRNLYIEKVLCAMCDQKIKMSSLDDLALIGMLDL